MEAPDRIPPLRSRDEVERVSVTEGQYGTLREGKYIVLHEFNTSRKEGDRLYVTDQTGGALPVMVTTITEVKDEHAEPGAPAQHYFEIQVQYKPLDEDA